MKTVDKTVIENIRRLMSEQGMSQRKLAKDANSDTVSINRVLRGKAGIGPDLLERVAKALGKEAIDLKQIHRHAQQSDSRAELILEIQARLSTMDQSELRMILNLIEAAPAKARASRDSSG